MRRVWEELQQATLKVLDGITIADLAEREEREANVARYSI